MHDNLFADEVNVCELLLPQVMDLGLKLRLLFLYAMTALQNTSQSSGKFTCRATGTKFNVIKLLGRYDLIRMLVAIMHACRLSIILSWPNLFAWEPRIVHTHTNYLEWGEGLIERVPWCCKLYYSPVYWTSGPIYSATVPDISTYIGNRGYR